MVFVVKGRTIAEAWEKSMILLLLRGKFVPSQRGAMAKELMNVIIQVDKPHEEPRISTKYPNRDVLYEYLKERPETSIIRGQIEHVTNILSDAWFSRRAVISLWSTELMDLDFPFCIIAVQFMIREQKLNMTAFLRSNDAWNYALADMILLTDLQRDVAKRLKVACGSYTHHAVSYHIYDYDYDLAMESFSDYITSYSLLSVASSSDSLKKA